LLNLPPLPLVDILGVFVSILREGQSADSGRESSESKGRLCNETLWIVTCFRFKR